jgi:GNAT superfamily N-acetyltransferase
MEISIRRATSEDAGGVLRCLHEAFEEYRDRYTATAYLDTVLTPQGVVQRLTEMRVFVAVRADGEIVGTISSASGHLRGLAVRPAWQGNGVASRLLQAAEADLRGLNCSRVTLGTTDVLQGAVQFYEGRGYRRSGRVTDFFGMNLIEYVKELE